MMYKTSHYEMGKGGRLGIVQKKMRFDHTTKWYMQKPEFDLENET